MPKKPRIINLDQILSRRIKGYAFCAYPLQGAKTPQEYRERIKAEIEADYATLPLQAFRDKYRSYIY